MLRHIARYRYRMVNQIPLCRRMINTILWLLDLNHWWPQKCSCMLIILLHRVQFRQSKTHWQIPVGWAMPPEIAEQKQFFNTVHKIFLSSYRWRQRKSSQLLKQYMCQYIIRIQYATALAYDNCFFQLKVSACRARSCILFCPGNLSGSPGVVTIL